MSTPVLEVQIPGDPRGKGRPRFARRGNFVKTYTDDKTRAYEAMIEDHLGRKWFGLDALTGPVRLTVRAVAKRPQRLCRKKDPPGRMWRITKPDLDNVIKAVCDALVAAEVIGDDTQVAALCDCMSLYAAKGEDPCVEVVLRVIEVAQ